MNLRNLENKTILLFGQPRAFSKEEFGAQLKVHNISIIYKFEDGVSLIIDGKMMTPYETAESEKIYELKKYDFTSIDIFEETLAKTLDEETLLMSLKLSGDKSRLKSFIQNSKISDKLFIRLLKMYNWNSLNFFESDDNRDVSAALIRRYYKNIEQNHNVEYASLGILHLISQTTSSELISTIAQLEPTSLNENIKAAIATHLSTQKNILEIFLKDSSSYIKTLIAMRKDLDEKLEEKLILSKDEDVKEALSFNPNLFKSSVLKLIDEDKYVENIAQYIKLDDELFELLHTKYANYLAKNNSLSFKMQEFLVNTHNKEAILSLASNDSLDTKLITELLVKNTDEVNMLLFENNATPQSDLIKAYDNRLNHFALANNENTPEHILNLLAQSGDVKVLLGLAGNPSTPIDTLYQLQLDAKLAKVVKTNKTFLENIKKENIGWL